MAIDISERMATLASLQESVERFRTFAENMESIVCIQNLADGSMEFVGENMIDHTPKDEKVDLTLGNAFDLVGERVVKDSRRISNTVQEDDVEITLRNHKESESVEILVKEHFYGRDWKILKSNFEYNKKDANTAEFKIPVNAGQEVTLSYTVRIER